MVAVLASSCARKCCILALISSNTDDTWPAPNVPMPVPAPTVAVAVAGVAPVAVRVPVPVAAVTSGSARPTGAATDALGLAALVLLDDEDEDEEVGRVGGRPDAAALPALPPPPRVGDETNAVSDFPWVDTDLLSAFLGALGEEDVAEEEEDDDESMLSFAALMVADRMDCVGRNMICC